MHSSRKHASILSRGGKIKTFGIGTSCMRQPLACKSEKEIKHHLCPPLHDQTGSEPEKSESTWRILSSLKRLYATSLLQDIKSRIDKAFCFIAECITVSNGNPTVSSRIPASPFAQQDVQDKPDLLKRILRKLTKKKQVKSSRTVASGHPYPRF